MGGPKSGNAYWFNVCFEGKRIQESLKTDNRKVAEKRYAKVLTDLVEGRYFETNFAKKVLFQQMTERYLEEYEHSRDRTSLKALSKFFNGYTLFEIKTRIVADYRRLRAKKVKPATVYQELALLRRMFNVAIREWEWVKDNPVSRLSFSVGNRNARDRWLTMEEETRLLDCIVIRDSPHTSDRSIETRKDDHDDRTDPKSIDHVAGDSELHLRQ